MATISPTVQTLLEKNAHFASAFTPLPNMKQYAARIAADPSTPRICILSCADPRVVPEQIFGLGIGEALVIRTAGGNVQPALSSMLAIDSLFGFTDVIVMRHTDCGTTSWTDEKIRDLLEERSGGRGMEGRRGEKLQDMGFCESVGDMEQLLKEDVEWLRNSPLVRDEMKKGIVGAMYDVDTGKTSVIC